MEMERGPMASGWPKNLFAKIEMEGNQWQDKTKSVCQEQNRGHLTEIEMKFHETKICLPRIEEMAFDRD